MNNLFCDITFASIVYKMDYCFLMVLSNVPCPVSLSVSDPCPITY